MALVCWTVGGHGFEHHESPLETEEPYSAHFPLPSSIVFPSPRRDSVNPGPINEASSCDLCNGCGVAVVAAAAPVPAVAYTRTIQMQSITI